MMDESGQPAAAAERDHRALFTQAVVYFHYVFSITPANINYLAEKLLNSGLAETVSSPKDGEVRISNRFAPINTDIQHIIFDYYLYNSGASKFLVARQYPWQTACSLARRLIKSVSSVLTSILGPSRRETVERIAHQETGDDETTAYDRLRESIAQLQVIPAIQHTIETDLYQPGYLQGEPYLRLSLRAAHIELAREGQQPLSIASEIQLLIHRSGVVQLLLPCRLPDPVDTDDLISHMTSTGVRIASVEVAEEVANLYALNQRSKVNQLSGVLRDELSEGTRWRRFEMDGDELTDVFGLYQGAILHALGAELTGDLWYCYSSTFVTPTCCDSEAEWMSAHTAELSGILTRHRSYRNYRQDARLEPPENSSLHRDHSTWLGEASTTVIYWDRTSPRQFGNHLQTLLLIENYLLQYWQIRTLTMRMSDAETSDRAARSLQRDLTYGLGEIYASDMAFGTAQRSLHELREASGTNRAYNSLVERVSQMAELVTTRRSELSASRSLITSVVATAIAIMFGLPAIADSLGYLEKFPNDGWAATVVGPVRGIAQSGNVGAVQVYLGFLCVIVILWIALTARRGRNPRPSRKLGRHRAIPGVTWVEGTIAITRTRPHGSDETHTRDDNAEN